MDLEFGCIRTYCRERGFGFVSKVFKAGSLGIGVSSRDQRGCRDQEAFFHISAIRRCRSDLAARVEAGQWADVSFWYRVEEELRGSRVVAAVDSQVVARWVAVNRRGLTDVLSGVWFSGGVEDVPAWLCEVVLQVVGEPQLSKWKQARDGGFDSVEQMEQFDALVEEMRPLGYEKSREVSNYIVRHRLGLKYSAISGRLVMSEGGRTWDFMGGIDPRIYARLCHELHVGNQKTPAKPVEFTPFKHL